MKKEIEQAERRAKEKLSLEKQVAGHKKTIEENEAAISKLQSDLQKLSELRSKEREAHKTGVEATRNSVKNAEEYCAGRFASFSEMLSSKMIRVCIKFLTGCYLASYLVSYPFVVLQSIPPILRRSKLIWLSLPSC